MNKQTEITIKLYDCIQWQMHCDVFVFSKNFVNLIVHTIMIK